MAAPRPGVPPRTRARTAGIALFAIAVLGLGSAWLLRGSHRPATGSVTSAASVSAARGGDADSATSEAPGAVPPSTAPLDPSPEKRGGPRVLATLGWGRGPGQIGLPAEEEGHGETRLRLAAGGGGVVLLDAENQRLVRLGADGKPGSDVRLPMKEPRDVAITKDGTILLLDADKDRASVSLLGADGAGRGKLPVSPEIAATSRGVMVSGNDVYVESMRGELRRIGDLTGKPDPNAATAPGQPTRDGRGYVTALLPSPDAGFVHVYVVERGSLAQRFSRELRPRLSVEGIFLVDTNASGVIYIGVTGSIPGSGPAAVGAELLCLEPERGEVLGAVDLPVRIGPEAILDAKALDAGGVVYSVFTKLGLRIERHDCMP